ncbi:MAG: transcriptional repressor [Deltaproteobacteria bacterium]|nr:transcriptional repressor [Candidatus Zymogenaceae bacterium]
MPRNFSEGSRKGRQKIFEEFKAIFAEDGGGDVEERLRLLSLFLENGSHLTMDGLEKLVRENGWDLEPETLQSYIATFINYGIIHRIRLDGGKVLYEYRDLNTHHDHMVCVKCGRIQEFTDPRIEALQERNAHFRGFIPLRHNMTLYGLCPKCSGERERVMPLSLVSEGEIVRITDIGGGRRIRQRLVSMGLVPGKDLEVIRTPGPGPAVVAVDGSRIALGQVLSRKVLVSTNGTEET